MDASWKHGMVEIHGDAIADLVQVICNVAHDVGPEQVRHVSTRAAVAKPLRLGRTWAQSKGIDLRI